MTEESYHCIIDDLAQLIPFPVDRVRWLDPNQDRALIAEYFMLFGAEVNPADPDATRYFGMCIDDYTGTPASRGRMCGWVEDGQILSFAALEYRTQHNWELSAGSTHPDHMSKGYCRAVCSFLAEHTLENQKQLTCETHIENLAAQKALQAIGMRQIKEGSS